MQISRVETVEAVHPRVITTHVNVQTDLKDKTVDRVSRSKHCHRRAGMFNGI